MEIIQRRDPWNSSDEMSSDDNKSNSFLGMENVISEFLTAERADARRHRSNYSRYFDRKIYGGMRWWRGEETTNAILFDILNSLAFQMFPVNDSEVFPWWNLVQTSSEEFVRIFQKLRDFVEDPSQGNVFQIPLDNFYAVEKRKLPASCYRKQVFRIIKKLGNQRDRRFKARLRILLGELNVIYYRHDGSYIYADLQKQRNSYKIGIVNKRGRLCSLNHLSSQFLSLIHYVLSPYV